MTIFYGRVRIRSFVQVAEDERDREKAVARLAKQSLVPAGALPTHIPLKTRDI